MTHDRTQAAEARDRVLLQMLEAVDRSEPLVVLKAPPGSGKTYVTERAAALAYARKRRVAIACQTNTQVDDFCRRMAEDLPGVMVVRFASAAADVQDLGRTVRWESDAKLLPTGPSVVVSTAAKWATSAEPEPFDVLLIDEAWQLGWADFMLLSTVAKTFILVGDPGQIAPVVSLDTARWETARLPPHRPAPELMLRDAGLAPLVLSLPVTTRLPYDTAALVGRFYDFEFGAWAGPGDRCLKLTPSRRPDAVDAALDLLSTGSIAGLTLPTPGGGAPADDDPELAIAAARLVARLVKRRAVAVRESGKEPLQLADIGLCATHRVMVARLQEALAMEVGAGAADVRVDTAERWQGLERKVMVAVHPLSGVVEPSTFDLDTGRLCVMASRHQVGLILVGRDHIADTLAEHLPSAEQPLGLPDVAGRGHAQHQAFWSNLQSAGRIVVRE